MGLIDFLFRMLGLKRESRGELPTSVPTKPRPAAKTQTKTSYPRLHPLRFKRERWSKVKKSSQKLSASTRPFSVPDAKTERPYPLANQDVRYGGYLDLSQDSDPVQLRELELPQFTNPPELAEWLGIPVGQLGWLTYQFDEGHRPLTQRAGHYHLRWQPKRSYSVRLIESPKPLLKQVQRKILREILDHVPAHSAAHGFVSGESILTNAKPHCRQRVIVKFDLENFYPRIRFRKVTAIFRAMGYSREAAIWLARLCTSNIPVDTKLPSMDPEVIFLYTPQHLPQGAPTSPALANLAAYGLDVRLEGLARSFGANYTRYADDLTFSGDDKFLRSLKIFIPLVEQIIRETGFSVNKEKRKVIRDNQRQAVTGVVVNQHPNMNRKDYDRLKAILNNCVRHGAESQNRDQHPDYQAHLRGRVAHLLQLNPKKGTKLQRLFERIQW